MAGPGLEAWRQGQVNGSAEGGETGRTCWDEHVRSRKVVL